MSATVAVCGFGRCGSSMVMRMLDVGGIPPVAGSASVSYELRTDAQASLTADDLDGRAIKLLDVILHERGCPCEWPAAKADWRIIWLDRNHQEQAKSTVKLLNAISGRPLPTDSARRLAQSYGPDKPRALRRLRMLGPVYCMSYEAILADPIKQATNLRDFLRPDFDLIESASAVVVQDRHPACADSLAFETSAVTS